MSAIVLFSTTAAAFTCGNAPAVVSRPAVHSSAPVMSADSTRRQLFAKAGAALLGAAFVEGASAKAGEFGKIGIFGMDDISSPYQPGGPKSGKDATYGFQKTEGEFLAANYEADVTREKAAFLESARRIGTLSPKIESKTWWFVRDELRIQAYTMRSSMLAMNNIKKGADKASADAAYKKFWSEIESLDLACKKKELALAQKEYADVMAALEKYSAMV